MSDIRVPIATVEDVLTRLTERDASYVPSPLHFAVGSVIRFRYPRSGMLKRYGVSELQYEVLAIDYQLRAVTLRKMFTKARRTLGTSIECVNAWYEEVSVA